MALGLRGRKGPCVTRYLLSPLYVSEIDHWTGQGETICPFSSRCGD